MGGYNSGRRSARHTIEATGALKLDVHRWMEGFDAAGATMCKRWTLSGSYGGAITATINPVAHDAATIVFVYDIRHVTTRTGPRRQEIAAVATPAPFGGQRWWWICPATGKRVVKLYLPNGGTWFCSRQAYRLDYACQRGTAADRAWAKDRRLRRKLGADPISISRRPDRPKGMHRTTYDAICEQLDDIEQALNRHFLAGAERLVARWRP